MSFSATAFGKNAKLEVPYPNAIPTGMSLRAYLAGQALAGIDWGSFDGPSGPHFVAGEIMDTVDEVLKLLETPR